MSTKKLRRRYFLKTLGLGAATLALPGCTGFAKEQAEE